MDDDHRRGIERETEPWSACPHIDRNDLRCATRFSLGRLSQAYTVCFGSYRACPMYHRLNAEHREPLPANLESPAPLITITAHGRALPLRRTGS